MENLENSAFEQARDLINQRIIEFNQFENENEVPLIIDPNSSKNKGIRNIEKELSGIEKEKKEYIENRKKNENKKNKKKIKLEELETEKKLLEDNLAKVDNQRRVVLSEDLSDEKLLKERNKKFSKIEANKNKILESLDIINQSKKNVEKVLKSLENDETLERESKSLKEKEVAAQKKLMEAKLEQDKPEEVKVRNDEQNIIDLDLSGTEENKGGIFKNLLTIPREISKLEKLRLLDLSNTKITDLTPLATLKKLKILLLSDVEFDSINASIISSNLEHLDLSRSKFNRIENLGSLKTLKLHNSVIKDLKSLVSLNNLEELDLSNTPLKKLNGISNFRKLRVLKLSESSIGEIEGIEKLTSLEELYLNGVKVDIDFSKFFKKLKGLRKLDISQTNTQKLNGIKALERLEEINISNTKISELSALSNLKELLKIDASNNHEIKGNGLEKFGELKKLKQLYLNDTRINDISALKKLEDLSELYLNKSNLEDISNLAYSRNLKVLHIADTKVKDLSPIRKLVESGIRVHWSDNNTGAIFSKAIFIQNCPLLIPPIEIARLGNKFVLDYFKQIPDDQLILENKIEIQQSNNAKIFLIGKRKIGERLVRDLLLNIENSEESSRVIHEGSFEKEGKNLNVRLWDFSSNVFQPYLLQSFFYTESKTLFILTVDEEKEKIELAEWLLNIYHKENGKNLNSFLIVRINPHSQSDSYIGNYLNKNRIKWIDETNNSKPDRFDKEVKTKVANLLFEQEHFNIPIPSKWFCIKKKLKIIARSKKYISLQKFFKICNKHGFKEFESIRNVSQHLHESGTILHYWDDIDMKNILFLRPSWIINSFKGFLDDPDVKELGGIITKRKLSEYWNNLKPREVEVLSNLFLKERFGICFKLPDREEYLVPAFLNENIGFPRVEDVNKVWKIFLTNSFISKSFFYKIIANFYHLSENIDGTLFVGRNDILIGKDGVQAFLSLNKEVSNRIEITIWGDSLYKKYKKHVVKNILDEIEYIRKLNFRYINLKKEIPCNCEICSIPTNMTHTFDVKDLEKKYSDYEEEVPCSNGRKAIVIELLDGLFLDVRKSKGVVDYEGKFFKETKKLIRESKLKEAIKKLVDHFNDKPKENQNFEEQIISIYSDFNVLNDDIINNTISRKDANTERASIRHRLIDLLGKAKQNNK